MRLNAYQKMSLCSKVWKLCREQRATTMGEAIITSAVHLHSAISSHHHSRCFKIVAMFASFNHLHGLSMMLSHHLYAVIRIVWQQQYTCHPTATHNEANDEQEND